MSNRIGSSLHDWINSISMIITFCVAIVAAVVSWKTYQLKEEDLLIVAKSIDNCPVEFIHFLSDNSKLTQGFLNVCWIATVSNKSENKISIVRNYLSELDEAGKPYLPHAEAKIDPIGSNDTTFPVVLEGGVARQFRLRMPVKVPSAVLVILDDFSKKSGKPLKESSFREIENFVRKRHLTLLGDAIEIK